MRATSESTANKLPERQQNSRQFESYFRKLFFVLQLNESIIKEIKMKIQKINSAINFGHVTVLNKEYEKILKPYEKELNKITDGYDVYIEQEPMIYAYNKYFEENISLHQLPRITIRPYDSATRTIPEIKFIVHPGAGEYQTEKSQAKEIIGIIKKAMSFYK